MSTQKSISPAYGLIFVGLVASMVGCTHVLPPGCPVLNGMHQFPSNIAPIALGTHFISCLVPSAREVYQVIAAVYLVTSALVIFYAYNVFHTGECLAAVCNDEQPPYSARCLSEFFGVCSRKSSINPYADFSLYRESATHNLVHGAFLFAFSAVAFFQARASVPWVPFVKKTN